MLDYHFTDLRYLDAAVENAGARSAAEGKKRLAQLGDAVIRRVDTIDGFDHKLSTGELLHISHIRMDWQPKATGIFQRYKKETIFKEMIRTWNMGWYRNHQTLMTWINVPIKPWTVNREIDEFHHDSYDIPFYGPDALQADNAEEQA